MAATGLNVPIKTTQSYTVPADKKFVGQIINSGTTTQVVVDGVALFTFGSNMQVVKPVVFNAGQVISTTSGGGGFVLALCGQLYDV